MKASGSCPAKGVAHPLRVRVGHLCIVRCVEDGGDTVERKEDLQLSLEADALAVRSKPYDRSAPAPKGGDLIASGMDALEVEANDDRCKRHEHPTQNRNLESSFWALRHSPFLR